MARDRLLELQQRAGDVPTIVPASPATAAPSTGPAPAAAAPAPAAAPAHSADPESGAIVTISRPSRIARFFRRPAASSTAQQAQPGAQQDQPGAQQFQQELAELSTALAEARSAVEEVSRQQCRQLNSPRHQQQAWQQTQDRSAEALSKISRIKGKLDRLQKKVGSRLMMMMMIWALGRRNKAVIWRPWVHVCDN